MTNNNVGSPYKNFIQVPGESYKYIRSLSNAMKINSPLPFSPTAKEENKKKNNFFNKTSLIVLGVIAVGFFAFRGGGGSFGGRLGKFVESMDDKIALIRDKGGVLGKSLGSYDQFKINLMQAAKYVTQKFECASNFFPARDMWCEKMMNKIEIGGCKIGAGICNGLRNLFENITIRVHKNILNKTSGRVYQNLDELHAILEKAKQGAGTEQKKQLTMWQQRLFGISKAPNGANEIAEVAEQAQNESGRINNFFAHYQQHFGLKVSEGRRGNFVEAIKNIIPEAEERVTKWRSQSRYITDELTGPHRLNQRKDLLKARYQLTRNMGDICGSMQKSVNELKQHLAYDDKETRDLIKQLRKAIDVYEKTGNGPPQEIARGIIRQAITDVENRLTTRYASSENRPYMLKQIKNIQDTLGYNKPTDKYTTEGGLQILLKENDSALTTTGLFNDAKAKINQIGKAIDEGIDSELRMYQKFGEMKLGSAFTDVLLLLGGTALGARFIGKAEGADGKVEAALHEGIPILAAFGTLAYCTLYMWTMVPSLMLGGVVWLGSKILGNTAEDAYHSFRDRQKLTQKALAAYNVSNGNKAI